MRSRRGNWSSADEYRSRPGMRRPPRSGRALAVLGRIGIAELLIPGRPVIEEKDRSDAPRTLGLSVLRDLDLVLVLTVDRKPGLAAVHGDVGGFSRRRSRR